MLKLIALISKQPDITREAFIDYYEANHAPLIKRLLPMIGGYRRSYITPGMVPGGDVALDYDVVTELTFDDQATLDAFWETITRPEVLQAIREDESHFLLSDRTRMIGVHEYVSDN